MVIGIPPDGNEEAIVLMGDRPRILASFYAQSQIFNADGDAAGCGAFQGRGQA